MSALSDVLSTSVEHHRGGFLYGVYRPGNEFELMPTVEMEIKNTAEGYLVVNFRRSVITAELWRPEVARW